MASSDRVCPLEHGLETDGWGEDAAAAARSKPGGADLRWRHGHINELEGTAAAIRSQGVGRARPDMEVWE